MVWERIEEKQRQQREIVQREEEKRIQANRNAEQQKQKEQQRKRAEAARARQEREEHLWRLVDESGIIYQLSSLRDGIGGKKDIVANTNHASVTLVWGRYHVQKRDSYISGKNRFIEGEIDYSTITKIKDYSYIEVNFNLQNESMIINEKELFAKDWRTNHNHIIDALADAYLSPGRINTSLQRERERSSSSSSGSPECCCQ